VVDRGANFGIRHALQHAAPETARATLAGGSSAIAAQPATAASVAPGSRKSGCAMSCAGVAAAYSAQRGVALATAPTRAASTVQVFDQRKFNVECRL